MDNERPSVPSVLDNKVAMRNVVARAAHGLSLTEKRIVMAAISKLDSRLPRAHYLPPERRRLRVHASEYAELAGVDQKLAYRDLMAACERLFHRYVRFEVETPRGLKEIKRRWIESVTYHHGEGWCEVTIASEILRHLVELRERFLVYRLRQAEGLRSLYSWRLLEFLLSHSKGEKGSVMVAVEDLKKALEIPPKYRWYDVRRKVIEPAARELALKDGWEICWEIAEKRGKAVAAIRFTWSRSPQRDLLRES
ncbi:MAG TPA: RepB family plasmid replication initiator protein [Chromatiales bacterium]|nr:RepB family plasmid replication initiator protein [Chromatiales bacterium]